MDKVKQLRTWLIAGLFCFLAGTAYAQQIKVSGMVIDPQGEPLIGVTVVPVNGAAGVGTATDFEGIYTITVDAKSELKFSYVGYETKTVAVEGRSEVNVTLNEDAKMLEEVVVIGYGTMDKKEVTSAISHVSEKDFLTVSSIDPAMMIQGKVPGVSITNTGAGDPNNQASIQIRGVSSRSAGLGPLIVIDGVPGGNLTNINPSDIASFDILKDGA
ncbi:MAG: carboxypeptidase-like regulatory domain-containing protein, partial [Muribaculaceae bacterium]|nr:carboxypeptidase-like regulatory domain-containing protein [Muribaculaceae bacterium]